MFFSKSTKFNPYFGSNNYRQHKVAKVEIESSRFARECVSFVHPWMYTTTKLEMCLYEQTQIIANAACRVGNLSSIAGYMFSYFYCDPYFLFKFLSTYF